MEDIYQKIIENVRDGVVLIDKGVIKYVNPYACNALGYKEEEMVGEFFLNFVGDDSKSEVKKNYEKTLQGGRPFLYEADLIKKNGDILRGEILAQKFSQDGQSCNLAVIRDVGARKKAERIFHEQEERFHAITGNTPDIIARFDEECRYVYINKAGENEFGIPAKDFFWKTDEDLGISSEKSEAFRDAISSVFKTKKRKTFYSEGIIRGKRKYYYTIIVPEFFADGSMNSVLSITRDITEIREIDEAKTDFISITSHQLRSPLSVINWCAISLLREDAGTLKEEQREYLGKIYDSTRNLIKITDVFLNTTMLDLEMFVFNPQEVNIAETAREVIYDFSKAIKEKNILVEESITTEKLFKTDPRVFKIVLRGLLANAVDYTPDKGKVEILIQRRGDNILLIVGDSGCGILPEDRKKVFSKFYRAKDAQNMKAYGTGLDLYLIKSLLKKIGGGVKISSPNKKYGKGTVFTVKIPAMGEDFHQRQTS